jgi:Uma2 family endonuclease
MIVDIRRLTVEEYHRMGDLGILDPNEPVELIEGQVIQKPMKGTRHTSTVRRIENLLRNRLGERVFVISQDPVQLNDYSEPEPDIALVRPDPLYYEYHHPTPREIYLIIEVADSTLKRDREFKATVYAQAGIMDYWVLDISDRQLYVLREPQENAYQREEILKGNDTISILAFPDVTITIAEMLSPVG